VGFREPEFATRRAAVAPGGTYEKLQAAPTVAPLSTMKPNLVERHQYRLRLKPLPGAPHGEIWAQHDRAVVVSIERLDLVYTGRGADGRRQSRRLQIGQDALGAIRRGVVSALGLLSLGRPTMPGR